MQTKTLQTLMRSRIPIPPVDQVFFLEPCLLYKSWLVCLLFLLTLTIIATDFVQKKMDDYDYVMSNTNYKKLLWKHCLEIP